MNRFFKLLAFFAILPFMANAQSAVTVGSQVTSESGITSGKAYILKTGADRYITDNGTNYDVPNSANSATEASVYYLISNGDGTWKIKNYYTEKYWGVPVYNSALTSVAEASAGAWSLNFSGGIAYPSAPDASSTTRGIDRSSGKVWGWSTGDNNNHKVYIYEVDILTSPVNITSGWYQIRWVDINNDSNTDYTNADVESKYVRNYSEEVTVNGVKYPLYLANAPSSIDENAASLVYFEYERYESGRGVEGYLRSTSGHYITPNGSASLTKAGKNYIIYRSADTPDISVITSAYTNSAGAPRHSFVPRGKNATPYIGLTADEKFPAVNMYAVNPAYLGLQAWTVTFAKGDEEAQVTYTGNDAAGLKSVYNGGTFFLTTGVTPTASQFTAPNYNGFEPAFTIDDTNHSIQVTYKASVYTISHASRGSLIYNSTASTKYVWSSGKSGTFNASDANSQWVLYPTGTSDQYYLYNVGAGKFAIPSGTASTASWVFSNDAVAVTLIAQSGGTYKIKTATTNTYAAISNGYDGPIINYNDEGGNFTITKLDGVNNTTAAIAVNKLVDNVTPLSAIPAAGTSDWYIIRIKTHGTYADKYIYPAESEINYNGTNYPLTFDHGVNVRPAIDDVTYYTRIIREGGTVYWQLPNGKYLYGANSKFPISTATKSSFSMDYTSGSGMRMWAGSRYAVPYYLGSQYFIGETASTTNAYYDFYPIDLTTAGLTAWQVTIVGLDASTKATCSRSDVSGLTSVYNNGYFFLPSGVTPIDSEFTVDAIGSSIITTINSTDHTISIRQAPDFFCDNYGEKWVRIKSAKETSLAVTLNSVSNGANASMKPHDFFEAKQLWCFVGNANSFVVYNKAAGQDYLLVSGAANPGQNATITLQPSVSASNKTWKLGTDQLFSSDAPGYTLYATDGNGSYSLHGWQNDGSNVKYWGAASGGSHFIVEDASGEVTLALAGLDTSTMTVYTQNIANLPTTIVGSSSQTLLTKDNFVSRTAYVPNGSELTFGTPALFQNYGFTGYDGTNQTKTVTATTTPQTVTATFSVVRPDARYLWEPLRIYNGSGEKDYYRIPAIVTAKNGDVIAINDRRWNNDTDLGNNSGTAANPVNHHIDIIGVASSDNGATWGSEFMVMDGTGSGALAGYGDAAVVADRENNKVLVMACAGNVFYTGQNNSYHQTIQRTVLTHNGTTWVAETPTDVTDQFFVGSLASSDGMFIGSGVIAQSKIIKKGDYYRIYCAVLERSNSNYVFYSDDFGLTWTMMGAAAANDNEPKVAELPDGSVLLSVRKSYGRTFNVWTWNDDTYTTGSWGTAVASNNQTGGISFGNNSTNGDIQMIPAIKKSTGEMVTLAMQSVPTASSRAEVAIYYKELDPNTTYTPTTIAQNWSSRFLVTPHSSAYSSFCLQEDGRIGFYMEEEPIDVTGFYMAYVPLTIDEITTGAYRARPVRFNYDNDSKFYTTIYSAVPLEIPTGATAYYAASVQDNKLVMRPFEGSIIPAEQGALVEFSNNPHGGTNSFFYDFTPATGAVTAPSNNALTGTLVDIARSSLTGDWDVYTFAMKNNVVGFYEFTGSTLKAGKAFLLLPKDASGVRSFVLSFDDIQTSLTDSSLVTRDSSQIYTLDGRRVNGRLPKGIYIINGKKVLIK